MAKKIIQIVLLISLLASWQRVKAASIESSSSRVTVVPAKFELFGSQGETLEQSLKITNEDDQDGIFALSVESIGVVGEEGEVVMDQTSSTFPNYISQWTTFSEKGLEIKSKETKIVNYKIDIPKDAELGGKYASIVISMDRVHRSPEESGAMAKVISLVMLNVAGDFPDRAKVESFNVNKSGQEFDLLARVKNYGVSHIQPTGSLVITNIWGQKIEEVPIDTANILPGTIRRLHTKWITRKTLFGFYDATFVATYGQKQDQTLVANSRFFVMNWPLALSILVIIALTLYILDKKKIISLRRRAR